MSTTRNIGIALAAAAVMLAVVADLRAAPPVSLTVGGTIAPAPDGTSSTGAVWRVYPMADTTVSTTGTVGSLAADVWAGEIVALADSIPVGSDCLVIVENAVASGGVGSTGYYAVVTHVLTGNDPAEFPPMSLRPIPTPTAAADLTAYLTWDGAIEDPGDGGETNIIGYTVHRSTDGVSFTQANTGIVIGTAFEDDVPNDAEYYYAIGLVYRGAPPVTGAVLSAVSGRVFRDSDGDGLPDYFKIANDLAIGSGDFDDGPDGDPDEDGMSNYEHWISGTRANDPTSHFFVKQPLSSGEGVHIQWDTVAGRRYTLYRKLDLRDTQWAPIYGPVDALVDGALEYTDTDGGNKHFYRLSVQKP